MNQGIKQEKKDQVSASSCFLKSMLSSEQGNIRDASCDTKMILVFFFCFLITPNVTIVLPSVGVEQLDSPPQAAVNLQFNLL